MVLFLPPNSFILIVAVTSMTLLLLLVHKTNLGRAMRAVSESPANASLMGISVDKIIRLTFMLGAALAGIAGVLIALNYNFVHFTMGFLLGLKAFTAAVLGGIGNIAGSFVRWSASRNYREFGSGIYWEFNEWCPG